MRELTLATVASMCVAGCTATPPPPPSHGQSLGPCLVTSDHVGDTWYAIIDRAAAPEYAQGAFVAEFTVFVRAGSKPIHMWATATQDRIPIPSATPISNAAPSNCQAYEAPSLAAPPNANLTR